ncbi:ribonuclease P protein subunit [archaeon]|jgi:ribonuclease P protein subunit POP4|nr:ribonuclease P protein subunit [archaeon]MBT3730912.1 ribonuclease P protein subunit [archaeon]MBT4669849.1 ribonuclease P protein subunit [archaeon]MBT5030001.1 ribonuclease P protein subunit [archaeon]MBT5288102.1 ribonuclease P protein subunit [archaeon]
MVTKTNILKHELIGLDVEVVDANNKSQIGLKGKVVDETRNTLIIKSQKGEKKILKKDLKIQISVSGEKIIITGKKLVGRPEDRIKK